MGVGILQQTFSDLLSAIEAGSDLPDPVERVICGVRCRTSRREHISTGSTRVHTEHEAQLHLSCLLWMLLIAPDHVRRVWQLRDMPIDAIQSASRVIRSYPCTCDVCNSHADRDLVENSAQPASWQQQLLGEEMQ